MQLCWSLFFHFLTYKKSMYMICFRILWHWCNAMFVKEARAWRKEASELFDFQHNINFIAILILLGFWKWATKKQALECSKVLNRARDNLVDMEITNTCKSFHCTTNNYMYFWLVFFFYYLLPMRSCFSYWSPQGRKKNWGLLVHGLQIFSTARFYSFNDVPTRHRLWRFSGNNITLTIGGRQPQRAS